MMDLPRLQELAETARLKLDEGEAARLLERLRALTELAGELAGAEVPPSDVTDALTGLVTPDSLRADEHEPSLPRADALALGPSDTEGFFTVPRTLDDSN